MEIPGAIADQIFAAFQSADSVVIISHRNPDPDTLGSNLALRKILERHGKKVTSACVDELPPNARFLPELRTFVTDFNPEKFDLVISVDAGSVGQLGFAQKYKQILKKNFINIDHHPSNNHFGKLNLIMAGAAATTMIIHLLLKHWKEKITPCIATLLLYGLYYDTGSFMHSNTDFTVMNTAAELLAAGARKDLIVSNLYKSRSVEQLRLWGKALSNVDLTKNNVAVAGITEDDLLECHASSSDLSGLIDYVSSVKGSRFATLLCSDTEGGIKGSFRTRREDINVADMAENLGGGGHKKASGFTIKGKLTRSSHWSIMNE